MKTIRKLVSCFLLVLIGIFIGRNYGDWVEYNPKLVQEISLPYEKLEIDPATPPSSSETKVQPETTTNNDTNNSNYQFLENLIIEQVNELRQKLDIQPVIVNDSLREGAYIRALEIEESFSHTRPNGSDPFTVFTDGELQYDYRMIGENLAMATYFGSDESMAEFIFQGWVDSPDHYKTMINYEFDEIGVGIHYDGDILYATQFFGKQR